MLCLQTLAKLPAGQTLCKLGQEILSSKLKSGFIRCLSGLSNTLPQEQNPYCCMSTKVSKQAYTYGCGHFRLHEGHGCCIQPHTVIHLDQSCLVLTRSLHNFSSDSRRQVRKAQTYKHYPSSHFTRLRNLRAAIRKVLQKNAKYERKRLSNARVRMRERLEESLEKVKDIRENILTVPNFLSTTRLVLSPVLGYLVITEQYMLGTGLFIFTGFTDLLDGYIARNFKNQKSVLGSIIDPLADKCLISILTISLTISGLIPVPLTVLIVVRDVSLVIAAAYMRYKSLSPPITLPRYFDMSHATVQLKPTFVSKINTAVQLLLVGVTLPAPIFHYVDHISLQYLWYITATTTFFSGLSYIFSKDTVEFVRSTRKK